MLLTTTPTIENKKISVYYGIVSGDITAGMHLGKDIAAGFANYFGGRSKSYEKELTKAREETFRQIETQASKLGANAVVGMKTDYKLTGANGGMLLVSSLGTAVYAL